VERTRLEDGSFLFRCQGSLTQCLTHVEQVCHDATYRVLRAVDRRSYYGPRIGQVETENRTSEAVIRCEARGMALFGDDEPEPAPEPAAKPRRPTPRACVPGATQRCVGVGACAGGQVCLADGSRFGPCRCASSSEDAGLANDAAPPDAGTAADAVPADGGSSADAGTQPIAE